MPKTSSADRLAIALEDISEALKHPHSKAPFLDQGIKINDAICKLKTIFHPPNENDTHYF